MVDSATPPAHRPTLHAVVLAAGASSRFGSPKQLVRIHGQPLLHHALAAARELLGPAVTVVLGAHAAELCNSLSFGSSAVLVNRAWEEGIGSSIRAGITALPGACDGVMMLLADQPLVSAVGLERLRTVWHRQPRSIVASSYAEIVGVPAIFPRWCFMDLLSLRGDQGARVLMRRHADHVIRVAHPEAAVDIDRPEDLLELTT